MSWTRLVGALALIGFVTFGLLGGEYSTFDWWQLERQRVAEQETIERLRHEIDSLTAWAEGVESDSATQERVAREKFGMIRDGEQLFRVVPDER